MNSALLLQEACPENKLMELNYIEQTTRCQHVYCNNTFNKVKDSQVDQATCFTPNTHGIGDDKTTRKGKVSEN